MNKYLILMGLLVAAGCSGKPVQTGEPKVPAMNLSTILDTISINLDSQLNDYLIVPLETTPTVLIGDGAKYIFASEDYILVETEKGLQQFNKQGRFIRQLMSKGKGPNEFIYFGPAFIYKSGFYFNDITKSRERIYICDLSTGDVTSFPLAITGHINDMAMLNDSTILIVSDEEGENGRQFEFFAQDIKGKLIYSKDFGSFTMRSLLGPAHIHRDGLGGAYLSNPYCDSIMQFKSHQLHPIWYTLNLSKFNPAETYEKFLLVGYLYTSGRNLFLNKTLISSAKKVRRYGQRHLVEVRPDSLKAAIVRSFRIKDIDFDVDPGDVDFHSKTFGIAEYSAIDFKEKIRAILDRNDVGTDKSVGDYSVRSLDDSACEKLKALDLKITENDNPVLIIWRL
jgi:hypothetical protein